MNTLTYSLIYTPKTSTNYKAKYVCSDCKVHIRLKDFNSPQIIRGFEAKLTYLISYIFHSNQCSNIEDFMKLNDVWILNSQLGEKLVLLNDYKYKGLKILKNYNKQDYINEYGEIDLDCFPVLNKNSLKTFINTFKITDIISFLLDDSYQIIIHKQREIRENKFNRKQTKIQNKKSDLIELW